MSEWTELGKALLELKEDQVNRILEEKIEAGEDPLKIIEEIEKGAGEVRSQNYRVIPDRREAIKQAVALAGPHDIVLITGKGHEDYQIIGEERFPFDDREEARKALAQRGRGQ